MNGADRIAEIRRRLNESLHPDDLDIGRAAEDAAQRATRLLGATKPATERLTVVLDPFVTAQFLGILGSTLSGEAVLKGRSLFADRLGESVASPLVELVDDPTNPDAFTATATDGEGLATRRNSLIAGGRLEMFVHNTYTGRRLGAASTGSAVRSYASTPSVGCRAAGPTTRVPCAGSRPWNRWRSRRRNPAPRAPSPRRRPRPAPPGPCA